ncbi:MAG: pyrroline-5-carboxylate reductase [Alphaproteobacteria bacterium]|nr:pyrroline-5-carboxylate reductase [Alphaproteobacteria bacterium]MBV9694065.1 pyrroline-5-carboxylate reductase [Alphaproteobacteria bacterium]
MPQDRSRFPILLVGAGKMGGAMLEGWTKARLGPVVVVEPKPDPRLKKLKGVAIVRSIENVLPAELRACVVALKPQVLAVEAARLKPVADTGVAMISIAAGTSIATLKRAWGSGAHILRAMPNTPGAIGRGITAIHAGTKASAADRKLAERLLAPLGETVWMAKESLIDVTTAVSGSGPAYVFLLAEALADAAAAQGMPREDAERLARATVTGAGALLASDNRAPEELRRDVTSPGGTTEAALAVLMGTAGLKPLIARAVAAANKRAKELAS